MYRSAARLGFRRGVTKRPTLLVNSVLHSSSPNHYSYPPSTTRSFAAQYYKLKQRPSPKECPFRILGVDKDTVTFVEVKKVFLQVAMRHHPDTADTSSTTIEEHREIFVRARKAFEKITEGPEGRAVLASDAHHMWEEHDLEEWFQSETGHDMPFMSAETMREVAEVTEKMGGDAGLDRDGGMWTLARMVASNVKAGGDGTSVLQLEAGAIRDRQIDGVLRRKRRR